MFDDMEYTTTRMTHGYEILTILAESDRSFSEIEEELECIFDDVPARERRKIIAAKKITRVLEEATNEDLVEKTEQGYALNKEKLSQEELITIKYRANARAKDIIKQRSENAEDDDEKSEQSLPDKSIERTGPIFKDSARRIPNTAPADHANQARCQSMFPPRSDLDN
jgi:hypothetical protein